MSIVITGNPGVGKHTVTAELSERLNLQTIDVNKIAKNENRRDKIANSIEVDTKKLEQIFDDKFYKNKIIVGHLSPYILKKKDVRIMIVLRRSPYELEKVYENRNYSSEKITENIGSEILGVIAYDALKKFQEKVFQVNTTNTTINETVEKILSIIRNEKGSEMVDWLELVEEKNDLKKFFVD